MNIFKRAILYITRKKIKSIIMLFILFGIATAVLSGISVKKAANIARQNSNKDMANTFELQANLASNFEGTIPENLINKVSKVEGIKNYDGAIQGVGLDLENINYIKPEKNVVQYNDDNKYEKLFSVEAHENSEYDIKFISKSLKLVDGRHIVSTDKNKVLIHKALAELNNLKVGDTIEAKKSVADFNASTSSKSDYDLEIVGIFESENTERAGHKLEMPENLLITDIDTIKTLYGYSDGNIKYTNATFNTKSQVDKVISKVKYIPSNWNNYTIVKSEDTFLALSKSFDSLDKIINMVLIGAIIAGVIILSLVLAFWIQGRIHETGILLSIGISKFNIISQYIIELLLISILAFGGSYFSSKLISQNIGNTLVQQAGKQAIQDVQSGFGGFSLGNDVNSSLATRTVDEIDVKVEFRELVYVYVIGTVIIILSVIASSISIIRLKPKEILSKMS